MQMSSQSSTERLECAVCLDECLNAVRLDCNHIFCYLCVKGSALQSNNRCPVCRQPIANNYFENPTLIESLEWKEVPELLSGHIGWQYEGRNGWWLYDSRTTRDIQKAFDANESTLEVLIAGFVYVIDFDRMVQFRRNQPNRIRKIRRQSVDPLSTKGVAGLRTNFCDVSPETSDSSLPINSNEDQSSEENVQQNEEQSQTNGTDEPDIESNATDEDQEVSVDQNRGISQLPHLLTTSLTLTHNETYL